MQYPKEIAEFLSYGLEGIGGGFKSFLFQELQKQGQIETYDQVIKLVSSLISPMYPEFDEVAKRLYYYKLLKEGWGITPADLDKGYPPLSEVFRRASQLGHINQSIVETFTQEELQELTDYIKPDRDLNFPFKGLVLILKKYAFKTPDGRPIELPQHIYMRVAIQHGYRIKDPTERLEFIKQKYDYLSTHTVIEGSPKMINSLTPAPQMSSCILLTVDDDTFSILESAKLVGIYSKYSGGIGIDVSRIRASGSPIKGNRGKSKGGIPFIKIYEQVISAFDQMGLRKGACNVSFQWWHKDTPDYVFLKDAGGSDELRARRLQYSVKWNREFSKRILKDDEITLFDPKETPALLETWGREFSQHYKQYEQDPNIKNKRRIKARDLAYNIAKVRYETGNLYITFVDNINEQRLDGTPVYMSNLCQEVVIPSKPPRLIEEYAEDGIVHLKKEGEIGLCNLASINLIAWDRMTPAEKEEFTYNLLKGFDELIDNQFYPVVEAKISNLNRRPIGVGVFNYTYLLAKKGIDWETPTAKEFTHQLFEDISFYILLASTRLAKERGPYKYFRQSKWAKGLTPIDVSILHNRIGQKRSDLNYPLQHDWDYLREQIRKYGVRFSYHMALPPTATSSRVVGGSEGIEPILDIFTLEEGTYTLPTLAPEIRKYRNYYQRNNAWVISPKTIIELASIRQKFIDQTQSLTLYYSHTPTAKEIIEDIIYAEALGLKTLYYLKTKKSTTDGVICESCVL